MTDEVAIPNLPGTFTLYSYEPDASLGQDITDGRWLRVCDTLLNYHRSVGWWVGDALNFGEDWFGEDWAQAVEHTGYSVKTLLEFMRVARRVPITIRIATLTWGHHQVVASLGEDEQHELLEAAVAESWSVSELRHARRALRADPDPPGDPEPPPTPTARPDPPDDYVAVPRTGIQRLIDWLLAGEVDQAVTVLETWRDWQSG